MKVGQDYVSLWFQTETLGYKPTGFRVIIAAIPAVTWRKDKKYVVSIVSPWPSSSGLGEIAFFPTPWPLRLRLPSVQAQASNLCPPPPPPPPHVSFYPNEARSASLCWSPAKPRLPGRTFYFQNDSRYTLSIYCIPALCAQYSIDALCNPVGEVI